MEMPENRRAHIFILSILLEAPEELQKSFGERLTKDLQKTYQKLRASFSSSATLPPILRAIDKKYARQALAASSGEPRENPKSQAPLTEVNTTSKLNERSLHRLEERRKKLIQDEAAPIAPIQLPKREAALEPPVQQTPPPPAHKEAEAAPKNKVVQDPKKLPKASSELMAMNKKTKREKTEAEKIFEQATTLQKTNHLDDAVTLYQKTLRLNPDFAEVYKNLGLIYMERKDKERALRNFKIYLQLSPQSEDKQIVEGWISSLQ
jgi:tetratricopeptide (TPR) repeat protein